MNLKTTFLLAFTFFILSACTYLTQKPTQTTEQNKSESSQTSTYPLTITDHRNQQVTLNNPAQKIVTFPMPAPFLLTTIAGSADQILGMHASSQQAVKEGIMQKIFPTLLDKQTSFVKIGFEPNLEELLKLEPDLVIQWADKGSEIIDPITQSGLSTIGLNYGTQQDLESWMTIFGEITGQPQRAQDLTAYHQQSLAQMQALTNTIKTENKPKVLYLSPLDTLRTYGTDTYNDQSFKWTGAVNAAENIKGMTPITMEEIITLNPDIIYIGNFSPHVPADILESKLDGQDFSQVSAVKTNRVYKVPLGGYRWDPPNQESPLMWQWLLTVQHPELVNFDLRQNLKDFYQKWYNYQLTEDEIDGILKCELNATLSVCSQ